MNRPGLTARQREELHAELAERWPLICRWLDVDRCGWIDGRYMSWWCGAKHRAVAGEELAAAYGQRADFYEWRRDRRTAERGWDYFREVWTDSMCYSLRRSVIEARGQDPGPVIPQWERRPDLFQPATELRPAGDRALQDVA